MRFDQVLPLMVDGAIASRKGWGHKGTVVGYHEPTGFDYMTLPFLYVDNTASVVATVKGRVPYTPTQQDLLSTDWYLVEPELEVKRTAVTHANFLSAGVLN